MAQTPMSVPRGLLVNSGGLIVFLYGCVTCKPFSLTTRVTSSLLTFRGNGSITEISDVTDIQQIVDVIRGMVLENMIFMAFDLI